MEKTIKIGILGLGTVGTGVVKILKKNQDDIAKKVGAKIEVTKALVRSLDKERVLPKEMLTTNASDILDDPEIDIIVELMGGENPSRDYMLRALTNGKHLVTANKDVIAKYGKELFDIAERNNLDVMFEASVGGGIPIIHPLKDCLIGNKIEEIMGIINGTTNYMLTKMTRDNVDYQTVLAEAQAKGYAEADPTADVGGLDAARKIAILASIAYNSRITVDDVYVEGITKISPEDIANARELGYVIKLLGIAKEDPEHGVEVRVHPTFIPNSHPIASVNDVFNAIFVTGDAVGNTMFYGRGAGELPTASAVIGDIMEVTRNIQHDVKSRVLCTCYENKTICPIEESQSAFYVRLLVKDEPGVFAKIAGLLSEENISLNSVIQKRKVNNCAEIVFVTYTVKNAAIREALAKIEALPVVTEISNVIRVHEANE